jgi:hypothetical protein
MATPKNLEQLRVTLQREMPVLAQRYGVVSLGLFGSYVRRENRPDSDLDLLVTFDEPPACSGISNWKTT